MIWYKYITMYIKIYIILIMYIIVYQFVGGVSFSLLNEDNAQKWPRQSRTHSMSFFLRNGESVKLKRNRFPLSPTCFLQIQDKLLFFGTCVKLTAVRHRARKQICSALPTSKRETATTHSGVTSSCSLWTRTGVAVQVSCRLLEESAFLIAENVQEFWKMQSFKAVAQSLVH